MAIRVVAWLAVVGGLVEFVLVDELRGTNARIAATGGVLLILTGLAAGLLGPEVDLDPVWAATPPLGFLLLASLLGACFRRLKGSEVYVVFTPHGRRRSRLGASGGHGEAWDTAYTLILGVAWLLTLMPALTRLG